MADKVRFILSSKVGKEGVHKGKSEVVIKMYLTRTIRVQIKSGVFVAPEHFGDSEVGIIVPKQGRLNIKERAESVEAKMALDAMVYRLTKVAEEISTNRKEDMQRNYFLHSIQLLDQHEISNDDISYEKIKELHALEEQSLETKEPEAPQSEETFFETIEAFLTSKDANDDYRRHFRVTLRTMYRYELFCNMVSGDKKNFHWDIHDVSREDIEGFSTYMKDEDSLEQLYPNIFKQIIKDTNTRFPEKNQTHKIVGRGENTIIKAKKRLKQFFTWCVETGRTTNQPFKGITIGAEKFGTPYYITIEERNQIADFDFSYNKHLETQRDIFIFQCLVGCRVGDYVKFTPANIHGDILEYVPSKTKDDGQPVKPRVPLNTRALSLIEKYKGVDKKGRLFPFISTQKYNDAIKEIFTVAGITRIVPVRNSKTGETELRPINEVASSHMARRTFVGAAYKKVKDPNLVGKMSGHVEGSKAFARYREIDDDDLRSVIDMID